MRNGKKHLRYLFGSAMLFLFCFHSANAQPKCSANFSPWETCFSAIQAKEFVFFGRVVSIEKPPSDSYAYGKPLKIVVEIETSLKGKLVPQIELVLDRHCYGEVYENKRYIFTAERVDNEKVSGLFSKNWSQAIGDEYSETDVKQILEEIRSVIRRDKQPRLVGNVIEQPTGSSGRYSIASNEVKKLFASDYLRPLADVSVTAKHKDGRVFKAATDAEGGFVFGDLPLGMYEFYTNLPKAYDIVVGGNSISQEENKTLLEIRDYACSQRVVFNAQLQGGIQIRFDNASSRWAYIILHLMRVREGSDGKREMSEFSYVAAKEKFPSTEGAGDFGFKHHFKNVPVGKYLLMLSITTDPSKPTQRIYYPGTFEAEKAEVINVEPAETSNVEFSLPDLPEN